ncbi:MAG: hypothetical protein KKD86_18000 [Bacteroidetes bacterium]|nr:hypothetical protein [Bacteroidota bacterium]MBU1680720.1 hypothetical protein [Bacteroidota bacterium]
MNRKKLFEEKLIDEIISVAYGDASIFTKIKIRMLAKKNLEVKNLLDEYSETSGAVKKISIDKYPDELLINLKSTSVNKTKSFLNDLYAVFFSKPILSAAAIGIVLAAIISSVYLRNTNSYDAYTLAEVENAEMQTRQALAIIGNVFNKTQKSLSQEILADKVSRPINDGINTVNKLFN